MSRAGVIPTLCGLALLCLLPSANSQETPPSYPLIRPNEEIRVSGLKALKAPTNDGSDILAASLEVIFDDRAICCGRDSALEDSVAHADPRSIKDIIARLQGRHLLSDGRPMVVDVTDLAPSATNPFSIVDALRKNHALLMMWNSHLYVTYGAVFDEAVYSDGTITETINKLLLLDLRHAPPRGELSFTRTRDDWNKVNGLLLLTVTTQ
jgi:hypothetical protein